MIFVLVDGTHGGEIFMGVFQDLEAAQAAAQEHMDLLLARARENGWGGRLACPRSES